LKVPRVRSAKQGRAGAEAEGIMTPPLAYHLTGRGRPARVTDHRMQHVARLHMRSDRVDERASFVVHTGNVVIQVVWLTERP